MSLKNRALAALARREYSRAELEQKLLPHAENAEQLGALLNALEAEGWLSNQRFAQSLARRRGERFGVARIQHELRQHDLSPDLIVAETTRLHANEYERALVVWRKKFDALPKDWKERAKQARFLSGRGFSSEVIRRILEGAC